MHTSYCFWKCMFLLSLPQKSPRTNQQTGQRGSSKCSYSLARLVRVSGCEKWLCVWFHNAFPPGSVATTDATSACYSGHSSPSEWRSAHQQPPEPVGSTVARHGESMWVAVIAKLTHMFWFSMVCGGYNVIACYSYSIHGIINQQT